MRRLYEADHLIELTSRPALEAELSINAVVLTLGLIVLLFGSVLYLRHLATGIAKHFQDCKDAREVLQRAMKLDEITAAGILFLIVLAIAAVLKLAAEIAHMMGYA